MKINIEMTTFDSICAILICVIAAITVSYGIYRETQIRMTLVDQAKPASYGAGVLNAVDDYVAHKGVRKK